MATNNIIPADTSSGPVYVTCPCKRQLHDSWLTCCECKHQIHISCLGLNIQQATNMEQTQCPWCERVTRIIFNDQKYYNRRTMNIDRNLLKQESIIQQASIVMNRLRRGRVYANRKKQPGAKLTTTPVQEAQPKRDHLLESTSKHQNLEPVCIIQGDWLIFNWSLMFVSMNKDGTYCTAPLLRLFRKSIRGAHFRLEYIKEESNNSRASFEANSSPCMNSGRDIGAVRTRSNIAIFSRSISRNRTRRQNQTIRPDQLWALRAIPFPQVTKLICRLPSLYSKEELPLCA